jgi:glycosyltransferase involved in cell wall biosynthesis
MLSICVVTQQLGRVISGPGLHAGNLVRSLVADGHAVTVIAPADQRPPGDLAYTFVPVQRPLLEDNHARWVSLSYYFGRALHALEKTTRFDLVHFTDGREALMCPSAALRAAAGNMNDTYSAELHSLAYYRRYYHDAGQRWLYYRFVHLAEGLALPRLQAVLANSRYTAGVVASQYRLDPQRLFVCYKSVEAAFYTPALERRAALPAHPPRVLFLGGNMQRKGLPDLMQAAALLRSSLPACEFWVAGNAGVSPRLQALCRQLGVQDIFHFLGRKSQADLVDLYAQADLFAMPSLTEAFGMVFLEAMSAGVPVLGTAVGGVPEIIQDGQNGRLVPPHDPPALARAMRELLCDPALQGRFRQAGLETARSFSVARMMEETYRIYEKIIHRGGAEVAEKKI